jgi:hypothetical protein
MNFSCIKYMTQQKEIFVVNLNPVFIVIHPKLSSFSVHALKKAGDVISGHMLSHELGASVIVALFNARTRNDESVARYYTHFSRRATLRIPQKLSIRDIIQGRYMTASLDTVASKIKREDAVYALRASDATQIECFALTNAAYLLLSQTNSEVAKGKAFAKAVRLTENRVAYKVRKQDVEKIQAALKGADKELARYPRRGREHLVFISPRDLEMARFSAKINRKGRQRNKYKPLKMFQRPEIADSKRVLEIFDALDREEDIGKNAARGNG